MINISTETEDSTVSLIPEGRLDTINSVKFIEELHTFLENEEYLIIDFSKCNYLSSTGIRALLTAAKKLNSKGGGLMLSYVPSEVLQVIEMAGLNKVFHLFDTTKGARKKIHELRDDIIQNIECQIGDIKIQLKQAERHNGLILNWYNQGIVGYDELGISTGIGSQAESLSENEEELGVFITIENCSGFIPFNEEISPDFRVFKNPSRGGIFLHWGLSSNFIPENEIRITSPEIISLNELMDSVDKIQQKVGFEKIRSLVVIDRNQKLPSISVCYLFDREDLNDTMSEIIDAISKYAPVNEQGKLFWGAKFILNDLLFPEGDKSFSGLINQSLTIENIEGVDKLDFSLQLVNPLVWLINSDRNIDAVVRRIKVEAFENFVFESYKEFLTRRLYTDSLRVVVKQLHGGYSAQTFQVESYDDAGRKLRPTVLKIANRAMIKREADRCQKYALPFILNNSAIVLGTEFFGDMGALRYNFVGIGGDQSQLKWLTYYYNNWDTDKLEPLFDKIFLQILKPWYGQPVKEIIYPFKDHDPTLTFFGNLCETAEELLSISADDKFIILKETGDKLINPYWFLKYEYSKLREWSTVYYTSICHGDLNMQNILLDQDMNVYLIDFSETKPRSVISDFARLEAIFMCEHVELVSREEWVDMIKFLYKFYETDDLNTLPENSYKGKNTEEVHKNVAMTLKMRNYATVSTSGNKNIIPYYTALLEWVLPIVCYWGASLSHKKISMIIAGILCGKLTKLSLNS